MDLSVSRSSSSSSLATEEGLFEQPDQSVSSNSVMDKILQRRSLQLRDQQQAWQVHLSYTIFLEQFPISVLQKRVMLYYIIISINYSIFSLTI